MRFEVLIELLKHTKLNYSTFRLAQNYGQYTATAVGFHYSTAEFVATIDDDLQHAPHLIDQLFPYHDQMLEFLHQPEYL